MEMLMASVKLMDQMTGELKVKRMASMKSSVLRMEGS